MSSATPKGWKRISLGDLGRFTTSSVDKLTQPGERPVQLVNYMDVYRHRRIDRSIELMQITASDNEVSRYQVQVGDILFTPSSETPDDIGHSAVVADELPETVHSYHTVRLRPDSRFDLDLEFRGWMANNANVLRYFANCATGSTRYTLGLGRFASATFDLPPIFEQRRIAEILSTLDEAIAQTESLIAKHQQIKAGLMHDLFTRGVTPDGHLRPTREQAPDLYKESPLGWISMDWEIVFIADVFEIQLGKMLNKLAKSGKWTAPYLGNRSVQWDFVDYAAIEEMDFTLAERQKFSLEHGDLLVCEGGDVGRTAMWRGEIEGCFYQKAIHRLRPKSVNVLPAFMLRFMRFAKEHGYFREFTSQSSIAHLTQEKLGAMPMLMPMPAEQKRIAERFDIYDGFIQIEQAKLIKFRKQKHGLMHDLLTGRVCVLDGAQNTEAPQ